MEIVKKATVFAMGKRKVKMLFSTGDVASLVGVETAKSVAKWIDEGQLEGVYLPGSGERRVHRDALRRFLTEYNYTWAIRVLDAEEGIGRVLPPARPRDKK